MKKVLMIVGSLRKNSFNLQLAREIQRLLEDRVQVSMKNFITFPRTCQQIH